MSKHAFACTRGGRTRKQTVRGIHPRCRRSGKPGADKCSSSFGSRCQVRLESEEQVKAVASHPFPKLELAQAFFEWLGEADKAYEKEKTPQGVFSRTQVKAALLLIHLLF